jgi:hopanoid biosynthesis associated protein HpnK
VVNADDFGRSRSINAAVIRAHTEGILTTASLMVNELAFDEAVTLARQHPRLGVGLHLALVCGRSALPQETIPGLVNNDKRFTDNPVSAGFSYFFHKRLRSQLKAEIEAQFEKFRGTGLPLDHVNGHLNIHLHPVIFSILMENAERWGIRHFRLTRDSYRENARFASGATAYRLSHAIIYRALAQRSRPELQARRFRHTERVYGLLQNARVDEAFLLKLLPQLPNGESELYSHPSLDEFKNEFEALISPRVKEAARKRGVEFIRYQDLS